MWGDHSLTLLVRMHSAPALYGRAVATGQPQWFSGGDAVHLDQRWRA
ncbi:MAG: hypothetical protein IT328_27715 [Caldilineaceae bacterium]|nr:hypothetical protein [Caldilineaceae bacterium]